MFARWRNLAAAAGAFCLPLSFAHASIPSDELQCTRLIPGVRQQLTTEESWFRNDQDSWYDRYYGGALDEGTGRINGAALLPIQPLKATDEPGAIISDIESIDQSCDDGSANKNDSMCDGINCPCHDLLRESDDQDTFDAAPSTNASRTFTPTFEIESSFFDLYAPYLVGDEVEALPSESIPTAQLTGTIEPIFEDCDDSWLDEYFPSDWRSENGVELNEIEPLSPADGLDDEELSEDASAIEPDESSDRGSDYPMIYPGCDWNPYFPASKQGEHFQPALPEDLRSA
jgi:hypothetical protein